MFVTALALVALFYPRTIHSDIVKAPPILNPLESLSETPTPDEIKLAVDYIAIEYGLNKEQLYKTIQCESSFRYDAKNKYSTASGVAQFLDSTWKRYCKRDKSSTKDQLTCMAEMWADGEQRQWECYNMYY